MGHRQSRINSLIIKNITDVIHFEMKNPALGFVTVTQSEVTPDHSFAKIYVSFMGAEDSYKRLEILKQAKGFIRSALASKMDIYKVPDLAFFLDDSYEKAQQFEATLAKAKAKEKK
jgi:ribosome-binding factor A